MRLRQIIGGLSLSVACMASPAEAARGRVVHTCGDYIVVSTPRGFAILEVYGLGPSKDQDVVGDFESYGTKTVYSITSDTEFRVYVDDYWLSLDRAKEKIKDKCRR